MSSLSSGEEEEVFSIVQGLTQLSVALKELESSSAATQLSHYRDIPESVAQCYTLMYEGATLVHATSTKFTLLGKVDSSQITKLGKDLLQGCQLVSTGCIAIHDNATGCARSTRYHARQATLRIVHSVIQLIRVFVDNDTHDLDQAAPKTGVVWEACNVILEKRLAMGNRTAMRRDLLTYKLECNQTLEEFQQMLDAGPTTAGETETNDQWQSFLDGNEDQYSSHELPISAACVGILKCSRGALNAALQATEAGGSHEHHLAWLSHLHDLTMSIGQGLTDLGACLYPPLDLASLKPEIKRQADAVTAVVTYIGDAFDPAATLELPQETLDIASKVQHAVETRRQEALDAIANAECPERMNQSIETIGRIVNPSK